MIKRLDNVKLNISDSESKLLDVARKSLRGEVKLFKILKKSLDARDKSNIRWVFSFSFSANGEVVHKPPL